MTRFKKHDSTSNCTVAPPTDPFLDYCVEAQTVSTSLYGFIETTGPEEAHFFKRPGPIRSDFKKEKRITLQYCENHQNVSLIWPGYDAKS